MTRRREGGRLCTLCKCGWYLDGEFSNSDNELAALEIAGGHPWNHTPIANRGGGASVCVGALTEARGPQAVLINEVRTHPTTYLPTYIHSMRSCTVELVLSVHVKDGQRALVILAVQ